MSRALRLAIALHPRAWRERYAEEVVATVMDVADHTNGTVPLSEVVSLGLRGLWLRAKTSPSLWAGVVVIAAILVGVGSYQRGFYVEPSWLSFAVHAANGLVLALPIVAALSGWLGAQARRDGIGGVRPRLRRLWSDAWPVLSFVSLGFIAAVVVMGLHSGWPALIPPPALVIGAQVVLLGASIAIGQALGAVLPRVLALFAAPAAVVLLLLALFDWRSPLLISSGFDYLGLLSEPSAAPFARLIATVGAIAMVCVGVILIRPLWARLIPLVVIAGLATAIGVSGLPVSAEPMFVDRSGSELVCAGDELEVCLWPEQEAVFGPSLRADMEIAYDKAVALGLPVEDDTPRNKALYGMIGSSAPEADEFVVLWATTFTASHITESQNASRESMAIGYSIAILLGETPGEAWPQPRGAPRYVYFDASDIPDEAAARAVVDRWLAGGFKGVHSPSYRVSCCQ